MLDKVDADEATALQGGRTKTPSIANLDSVLCPEGTVSPSSTRADLLAIADGSTVKIKSAGNQDNPSNSTSNTKVALGGITPPAPLAP